MKTPHVIIGVAAIVVLGISCRKPDEASPKAHREDLDERHDYVAAIHREQSRDRNPIHEELDDIDRTLEGLHVDIGRDGVVHYDEKRADAAKVKELVDRRTLLRTDADALDASTEKDWETVKAKLDADLGDRPVRRGRI